jgi:hypothetical protein
MAPRRWVVNASPSILLGNAGHLDLPGALADEVMVSKAVGQELAAKPDGRPTMRRGAYHYARLTTCTVTPTQTKRGQALA